MITVREIESKATYQVRQPVLQDGRPIDHYPYDGDDLPTTFHLGAFKEDQLVGVTTCLQMSSPEIQQLFPEDYQLTQMRGMAVLPNFQGQQIGKRLVEAVIQRLSNQPKQVLWFNARIKAVPFYEKFGFEKTGEAFDVGIIGLHYKMFEKL